MAEDTNPQQVSLEATSAASGEAADTTEADPVGDHRGMVPVAALVAERARIRQATEEKLRAEYEPFKAQAATGQRLQSDLEALRPQLDYLAQHPELFQPQPEQGPQVGNEEAEKYARRFELYSDRGLDVNRAKQIIADNRAEMSRVATEAAYQVVQPAIQAQHQSRQNFNWAVQQKDPMGNPLVDHAALAMEWSKLPAELTARPEVAQHILQTAIGAWAMSGKRQPVASHNEPLYSEPAGGGRSPAYVMSDVERRIAKTAGFSEKSWADTAKTYKPDALNVLGE